MKTGTGMGASSPAEARAPDALQRRRDSAWSAWRISCAGWAVGIAVLTGMGQAVLTGPGAASAGAVTYVLIVVVALRFPAVIAAQVLFGQLLIARLLIGSDMASALTLVPLVAGVVATAELLATVARLDTLLGRGAAGALRAAGGAAVMGTGAYAVVVLMGSLPGPSGLLAIGLASTACVVMAVRLAGSA